jgi:hypothetical protein
VAARRHLPFELAIVSNRAHPEIGLTGQLGAIV